MLACFDLVIASESAVFADTHTRYGMVHGGGSTQRLRNLVGARKAKELIFTSEPIGAAEAERIGLVNRVVAAEMLEAAVRDLADKIMKNDAAAIGVAKRLINDGQLWGTAVGFELEARAYRHQRREQTGELKSRFDAFFEDR
jgi:enoyl-CoA hydratase/carnithine racemase